MRNRSPAQQARFSITREQRHRIYLRDRCRCADCGTTANLTLDHLVPLAVVLETSYRGDELRTRCRACNSRKGASPVW